MTRNQSGVSEINLSDLPNPFGSKVFRLLISQTYIGSPVRVVSFVSDQVQSLKTLKVEEFGALWLANQVDKDIDIKSIIDEVIPKADREKGPSVGEYFLYCIWNRMVEAVSKNKLSEWYNRTAVQHIRPVDLREFTRNYYTFMANHTESKMVCRGKNKEGRHHLRQVGLGLLVARDTKLPLYYSAYPGNIHDSKHFKSIMDEMFGVVCGLNKTKERLTFVIDKGMNSEGNYTWIDEHLQIHFITTYATYFAKKLAATPLDWFEAADTSSNRPLIEKERYDECLLACRTKGEYWGKKRTAIVTYSPQTARKKSYMFESKLDTTLQELLAIRTKVRDQSPQQTIPIGQPEKSLKPAWTAGRLKTVFD